MKWNQDLLLLPILWLVAMLVVETRADETMLSPEEKDFIVDAHNMERRNVSPGASDMRKIEWDNKLEELAKEWVKACSHKPRAEQGNIGANYYFEENSTIPNETFRDEFVQTAVEHWADSKIGFVYSIYCGEACPYVQMINALTEKIGCAFNSCPSLESTEGQSLFLVCFYYLSDANGFFPYQIGLPCFECPKGWSCSDQLCVEGNDGFNEQDEAIQDIDEYDTSWQTSWQLPNDSGRQANRIPKAFKQRSPQNRSLLSSRNNEHVQPHLRDNADIQESQIIQNPLSGRHITGSKTRMSEMYPPSWEDQIPEQQNSNSQDQISSVNRDDRQERQAFSPLENDWYDKNMRQNPYDVQHQTEGQYEASYNGHDLSSVQDNDERQYPSSMQSRYEVQYSSHDNVQGNYKGRYQFSPQDQYKGQYSSHVKGNYKGQYPPFVQDQYNEQHPSSEQGIYKGEYPSSVPGNYKGPYPSSVQDQYKGQYLSSMEGQYKGQYPSSVQGNHKGQNPSYVQGNYKGQYPSYAQSKYNGQYPSSVQGNYKGQYPSSMQVKYQAQYPSSVQVQYRGQYPSSMQGNYQVQYPSALHAQYKGHYLSSMQGGYEGQYPSLVPDYHKCQFPLALQDHSKRHYLSFPLSYYTDQDRLSFENYINGQGPKTSRNSMLLKSFYNLLQMPLTHNKGHSLNVPQSYYKEHSPMFSQNYYSGQYPLFFDVNRRGQYPFFSHYYNRGQDPFFPQ